MRKVKAMSEKKELFGRLKDGTEVYKYTITNKNNVKIQATDLGACITNIYTPDRDGEFCDVVLGYDTAEQYEVNVPSFGALVGRYANRISGAGFTVDGKRYELDKNNGENCLHSGFDRYNLHMYEAEVGVSDKGEFMRFKRLSPDGEQGFPGNFNYSVTYTLSEDNELIIDYEGISDKDTPVNITNHSYFNIGKKGEATGTILNDEIKIFSNKITVNGSNILPTGEVRDITGTGYDFSDFSVVGENLNDEVVEYDTNYVFENDGKVKLMAMYRSPESGRLMEVYSDLPGVQLYNARSLCDKNGKNGVTYGSSSAICFESQHTPNAVNMPEFESPVIKANEPFKSTTIYKFTTY